MKTLLDNPNIIKYLIESNLGRYNNEEYQNIVDRLSTIYNSNNNIDNDPNEYNGYTDYSYNKIINLILLLSKKTILKTNKRNVLL